MKEGLIIKREKSYNTKYQCNFSSVNLQYTVNKIVNLNKYVISPGHNNRQTLKDDKY